MEYVLKIYLWVNLANIIIAIVQYYQMPARAPLATIGYWSAIFISILANQYLGEPGIKMAIISSSGTFVGQAILGYFFAEVMDVKGSVKGPLVFFVIGSLLTWLLYSGNKNLPFELYAFPVVIGATTPFFYYSFVILKKKKHRFTTIQKLFLGAAIFMSLHYLDWPYFRTRIELLIPGVYIAFALYHILSIFIPIVANENEWKIRNAHLEEEVQEKVRQNQTSENLNRAKDEFLSSVSENLRAPLKAIIGNAEKLRSRTSKNKLEEKDALEVVYQSAKMQSEIVTQLLNVSLLISAKIELEPQWIDPLKIVNSVVNTGRPLSQIKRIELAVDFSSDVPMIYADPNRFRQICWNLLAYIIKLTNPGGEVTWILKFENGNLRVSLASSGPGIPNEDIPYVFETLSKKDTGKIKKMGGLELALVRELVGLHGGKIEAKSLGAEKGTRISFFIPVPQKEKIPTSSA